MALMAHVRRRGRASLVAAASAALILNVGVLVGPLAAPVAQAATLEAGFDNITYSADACNRSGTDDIPVKPDGGENPDMTYYPGIMTGSTREVTPGKNDICGVWEGSAVVNGELHYYLSWDIAASAGGTMSSIQVLKSSTSPEGDIALDINYSPSGGASVKAWEYSEGSFHQISSAGFTVAYAHDTNANRFEIVLNLSAAGVYQPDVCESFTSGFLYTRTSDSFTATLKDQGGGGFTIQNCGSLEIEKVGLPELSADITDAYNFDFTVDRADGGVVMPETGAKSIEDSIKIGETLTYDGVVHGTDYQLAEELAADSPWEHVSTVCTIDEETYNLSEGATFPVEVGKTTHCVITNQTSLLEIEKDARGDQNTEFNFELDSDTWTFDPVTITGSGKSDIMLVKPGTEVTITENLPTASPSWRLKDVTADGEVDLEGKSATLTTVAGELVSAKFTNEQNGIIKVEKITEPGAYNEDFTFTLAPADGEGESFTLNTADVATSTWTSGDLKPGDYTLTESLPEGWTLTSVTANGEVQTVDQAGVTVTLEPGATLMLVFTNTATPAELSVSKAVAGVADGFEWSFDFTVTGTDYDETKTISSGAADPVTFTDLVPGQTYTLAEGEVDGWTQDAPVCTVTSASGAELTDADAVAAGFQFVAKPGQQIDCAFTNTANPADLTLTKSVEGFEGDWSFDFTLIPAPEGQDATQSATNDDPVVNWTGLIPGTTYTVTEVVPTGWTSTIDAATCDEDPQLPGIQITAQPGASIECDVTNTATPTELTVSKAVAGVADGFEWSFAFSVTDGSSFSATKTISHDATDPVTFTDLVPGRTYTLTEEEVAGWTQDAPVCTVTSADGASLTDADAATAGFQFVAKPGLEIACAFTNTAQPAELTLTKSVKGFDGDWSFDFTLAPAPEGETATKSATNDNPVVNWTGLIPGTTYTVSEVIPAGWSSSLNEAACDEDPAAEGIQVTVQPGQQIECEVTNIATPAELMVSKSVAGVADGFEWSFDFTVTGTDYNETKTISSGAADPVTFTDLVPGNTYTLTEEEVAGWTQDAPVCTVTSEDGTSLTDADAATAGFQFTAKPGQQIECAVTNTAQPADLTLTKSVAGFEGDWSFDFTLDPAPEGETATKSASNANPVVNWTGLIPGTTYTVTEDVPAGWSSDLSIAACDEDPATDGIQVTAQPGQQIECEVTNTAAPGEIVVVKTADGKDGQFEFELTPLAGGDPITKTVATEGGTGSVTFTDVAPGQHWSVREIAPETGWTVGELSGSVTAADGSTRAIDVNDFVLNPGDRLELTITNTAHGEIVVVKNVEGADADFAFTGSWLGEDDGFTITTEGGTGSESFADLVPGEYQLSELPIDGYDGLSMVCTESTERTATTVDGLNATIQLDPGETVTCTVSNAEWGVIVVDKQTVPAGAETAFDFTLAGGSVDEAFSLTDDADPYVLRVAPGDYTVTEAEFEGWKLTDATCTDGAALDGSSVTAHVGLGETVTCTFTNAQRGDLNIEKTLVSGPERGEGDEWTTVYDITVTSESYIDELYTLTDELQFGDGINVTGVEVTGPEGVALDTAFDGISSTTVATDATIPALGEQVYTVTVKATVDTAITLEEATCAAGAGEGGSGWFNTASVEFWNGTADDDECVDQPVANVSIDKTGTDHIVIEQGKGPQSIEYTLVVTNDGPATATDVVVTDTLPAEVTFGTATATVGTCTEADGTITCELGDLAAGESVTITVTGTVAETASAGTIKNVAEVTTTTPGDNPGDNGDDHTTTVEKPTPEPTPIPPTSTPGSPLPTTGATFDPAWGWLALALLVAGAGLLSLRRRTEQE